MWPRGVWRFGWRREDGCTTVYLFKNPLSARTPRCACHSRSAGTDHGSTESPPPTVPLTEAVFNLSRTGLLVGACYAGRADLFRLAMEDALHQKSGGRF